MKDFPKFFQTYLPDFHVARMRAIFEEVKAETERRLTSTALVEDDRKGFGVVYAVGPAHKSAKVLSCWNWETTGDGKYRTDLSIHRFADDPMGADPGDSLAARMRVATAFADAANSIFDPDDLRFFARPLVVKAADDVKPAGLYPGDESDLLVIDLMPGWTDKRVIDRMAQERFRIEWDDGRSSDPYGMQRDIWHIIGRFNAARAMLHPSSRMVTVPDRSSIGRRIRLLKDEAFARMK